MTILGSFCSADFIGSKTDHIDNLLRLKDTDNNKKSTGIHVVFLVCQEG